MIELEIKMGEDIAEAASDLVRLHIILKEPAKIESNGMTIVVFDETLGKPNQIWQRLNTVDIHGKRQFIMVE